MASIEARGRSVEVDEDGYLVHFEDWDEDVACALAEREGVDELGKDRMDILKYTRQYYRESGSYPVFGAVCLNVGQPKDCVVQKFPDPVSSWKIAGIPNPGDEIETYLNHEVV